MPKVPRERSLSLSESVKPNVSPALSITCAPCRGKKIKCDSNKPTCNNCIKSPEACYYPQKLKPGLRPGTGSEMVKRVELLEDRMEEYEARLAEQEARLSQVPMPGPSFSYDQSLTPLSNPLIQAPNTVYDSINTGPSTGIPSGRIGGMSQLPPMSNPSQDQTGISPSGSSQYPFDRPGGNFAVSASPNVNMSSPASFVDPHILPPDDIVRDLISLYFKHIHPWSPILSPSPPDFNPPWTIVHHAIVVVSLRLSRDPRIVSGNRESFKQRAKQHVLAHAIESTSIASLQALALLALDLIGSEQGPSSWGILALLTRSAVHLGLSREDDPNPWLGRAPVPALSRTSILPPPATWQEDESRRRLFWHIFALDRYVCVSTGWDFALPDFDIKRRLPCSDSIWGQSEWYQTPSFRSVLHQDTPELNLEDVSPMAYLVEALDLLGRAHTLQGEKISMADTRGIEGKKDMTMTLTTTATRWMASRPIARIHQPGMRLMIQAIHHATLLKLNANHAYPALSNGEPHEPYVSTCLNSARTMAKLANNARSIGWATASSPLFIWGCWVAARVLFVHSFLNHHPQPDDDFELIISTLKEQAEYWGLATQYVKLLERAKRKWLSSTNPVPTMSNASQSLPEAIHVLLDLRRTAYSAVHTNMQETPHVTPPEPDLSQLPAWAVEPGLGDLYSWFDLPAGLYQGDVSGGI